MSWTSRRKKDKRIRRKLAIEAIEKGELTFREAAVQFNIPSSTLHYHFTNSKISPQEIFSSDEEKIILNFIEKRQEGVPLSKPELLEILNAQFLRVCIFIFKFF